MWDEYSILLHPNLPSYSLELLIFGANLSLYWNGYIAWARSMLRGAEARLSKIRRHGRHCCCQLGCVQKYVKKAELDGQLDRACFQSHS